MAYPHTQYQITLTPSAVTVTTSGDKAEWYCGPVPHVIRKVAIAYTVSGMTPSGMSVIFNHLDTTSGSTASAIATINGTSSDAVGHVVYKSGLNVTINPGEKVVFNNSNIVSGACNVVAMMWVEPKWEQAANLTNLRVTT